MDLVASVAVWSLSEVIEGIVIVIRQSWGWSEGSACLIPGPGVTPMVLGGAVDNQLTGRAPGIQGARADAVLVDLEYPGGDPGGVGGRQPWWDP